LCFGDDDLKTLFIVSGLEGTSSEKAGSVYRTRIEVAGTPVSDASTSLRKLTN
jgi:sugar lactone lactonase YvrE